ncbi:MAG: hypothetical protein P4L55_13900 [Syntrophobacteraceae bacterium]|nr:hypothetical protein [Syntrophobacteraceae bacterium]
MQGLNQLRLKPQPQDDSGAGATAAGVSAAAGTSAWHAQDGQCQLQGLNQLRLKPQPQDDSGAGATAAGVSAAAGTSAAAVDWQHQLQGERQLKQLARALKNAPLIRTSHNAIGRTRTFLIFVSPFRPVARP